MDAFLTAFGVFIQLLLGGMGVYVSLKPPKQEHHWYWIGAFMGVGLLGIALTGWLAQRASSAQDRTTEKLNQAITAATNANIAATKANNSSLAAQNEEEIARSEAIKARGELTQLINRRSQETAHAILELGTSTTSSIKAITPVIRTIDDDAAKEFKLVVSATPHAKLDVDVTVNDDEAWKLGERVVQLCRSAGWDVEGPNAGMGVTPFQGMQMSLKNGNVHGALALQQALKKVGFHAPATLVETAREDVVLLLIGSAK